MKEPNVSVMVSGFQGPLNRQIRVIGEATEPIAIPYREGMTLLDVMILTKGLTRYAAGQQRGDPGSGTRGQASGDQGSASAT